MGHHLVSGRYRGGEIGMLSRDLQQNQLGKLEKSNDSLRSVWIAQNNYSNKKCARSTAEVQIAVMFGRKIDRDRDR